MNPISSREMQAVDQNAQYRGVDTLQLMENAGHGVAREIDEQSVAIFAGRGGNGGDGLVAARLLQRRDVTVYLLGGTDFSHPDASWNWKALKGCDVETVVVRDSTDLPDELDAEVAVDAMLGIGVKGEPREPVASAIDLLNASGVRVVSVDVPSGLDPDTGEGHGVAADLVLSLHAPKTGAPGKVVDIGIPKRARTHCGPGDVDLATRRRDPDAHKGQHGKIAVIGGGPFTGAPGLSGLAALHAGADIATIFTPESAATAVASFSPDLIVKRLPGDHLTPEAADTVLDALPGFDAAVLGPGLGRHDDTAEAVRRIAENAETPLVVDADALLPDLDYPEGSVLTPHRGEFRRITDREPTRENAEREAAKRDATLLLKGPVDIITDGDRTKLNDTGNPRMAVGGTGDVLTGITTALIAVSSPFRAAAAAAFLNGEAGDAALSENETFTASEMLNHIRLWR